MQATTSTNLQRPIATSCLAVGENDSRRISGLLNEIMIMHVVQKRRYSRMTLVAFGNEEKTLPQLSHIENSVGLLLKSAG